MAHNTSLIEMNSEAAALYLSKHTLPLGLKVAENNFPWDETRYGTFTLLRLGERHVFVTCWHVWNKLQQMQSEDSSAQIVAYLTSMPCLVELNGFSLVDSSDEKSLDVAVFRAESDFVELFGMRFVDYEEAYLSDPKCGEVVYIVGYPGSNVEVGHSLADFGYMYISFRASSVSETRIILADEYGDREFLDNDDPQRENYALGGLSGSPAFIVRDGRLRFVGIVTDGSDESKTIIVSRLGCLKPDGTLDHAAIPWC